MKLFALLLMLAGVKTAMAQEPVLQTGNAFPDMMIANISNAPAKAFYLNKARDNKFYILNFWGTWCSPCIPEMDTLTLLQKKNAKNIQVIAISDDNEERKKKYLKNKPTTIWLATDTGYGLYRMLGLAHVGQSAIIGPDKKIIALVRTDSINQQLIDRLIKRLPINNSATIQETAIKAEGDSFGVDSLMSHSFTIRGYQQGIPAMSKRYLDGPLRHRRLSWWNATIGLLYRSAYGIKTYGKQEFFDSTVKKEEVNSHDMKNRSALYCVDVLVQPGQEDSIYVLLQQYLSKVLLVKVRPERRKIEVYVLKTLPETTPVIKPSTAANSSYEFSGRGYNGTKVTLADFADEYLSNELGFPVVDETNLTGYYDIKTDMEQRNREGLLKSLQQLGLMVEKTEREMPVIVYYK